MYSMRALWSVKLNNMASKFDNTLRRRDFLGRTVAATFPGWAMRGAQNASKNKRARLACNSWPLRAYFDTPQMHEYRNPQYPLVTQAEFPQFLADHFNIHNVEFLPQHFVDTDPSTIDKVKAGLKKSGSRCCNLMGLEIPGGVFVRGSDHQAVIKEAERWVAVAVQLGSPSITVALTGEGPTDPKTAAYNLTPFVEVARKHGLNVLFHNDSLKTESAEILTAVIAALGRDGTGTCPDFGNFATRSASFALTQLRMLAPYASTICHAKDGIADNGKFYAADFAASMKIMRETGFNGLYSLEFEGLGAPLDGLRKLMDLTEQDLEI
jgi:sugar phosphate isomerase/epimerase